jgi:cysteine desulfurase
VGCRPGEVIFTSGGTESDNLAIKGAFWSARQADTGRTRLVSSAIEHHAVLDTLGWLAEAEAAEVALAAVDRFGQVDLEELSRLVTPSTALVTIMWANNEVGTLQPVNQITALAAAQGVRTHSDAVQAVGHVAVDFAASGLDTLTFTAHKLGGPYGIGALLAQREVRLTALLHGGGQERDVRSGTLDVAAIAGFAAAVEVAVRQREAEEIRLRSLRTQLIDGVLAAVQDAELNGPAPSAEALPGVANLAFPGCEADAILMLLDAAGIDCSTGSACSAGVSQPSHVLMAMGRTARQAGSCLRFSLGHTSTPADVAALLAALPDAVDRARAAGSLAS